MKQGAKLFVDSDAVGVALCVPRSLWHTVARFFGLLQKFENRLPQPLYSQIVACPKPRWDKPGTAMGQAGTNQIP
jgi:hypothetical protein